MLNLHVIQARFGDCLLLEHGTPGAPRYLLVDGGPETTYAKNLSPLLRDVNTGGGRLDLMILSHVDDDHVHGLLDLVGELQAQRWRADPETIAIGELWHNSFSGTVGRDVQVRLGRVMADAAMTGRSMPVSGLTARDIAQGDALSRAAADLHIPVNAAFTPPGVITVEGAPGPLRLDALRLWVVGPSRASLENLRQEWLAWLQEQEGRMMSRAAESARAARKADTSIPNLSSIMLLAEADGRRILLTGDGRADHLLEGLRLAGLLDAGGRLHVDVLKLAHHGSKYNNSQALFEAVTADTYVVSASGVHGHPHFDTLYWIVEAARRQGRRIDIVITNSTRATRRLEQECDPALYSYRLIEREEKAPSVVVRLA